MVTRTRLVTYLPVYELRAAETAPIEGQPRSSSA